MDSADAMDDEGGMVAEEEEDEYSLLGSGSGRIKKAKGKTKTKLGFYLKFIIALLIISAYYLQNFLLNKDAVTVANELSVELNQTV